MVFLLDHGLVYDVRNYTGDCIIDLDFRDIYDYSEVEYINNHTKVKIICRKHGIFLQAPDSHMCGRGCPSCAKSGFNRNAPAIMYYVSIDNRSFYKIGITNRTLKKRFGADYDRIKVVKVWQYEKGIDAAAAEGRILKEFNSARYKYDDILKSGNTELFAYDVLMLDAQ